MAQKKQRDAHRCFVAEGPKTVGDLFGTYPCKLLAGTASYIKAHTEMQAETVIRVTPDELQQISFQQTPHDVLAIFERPDHTEFGYEQLKHCVEDNLCLALDGVQDPGNVGTILRIADWFGIHDVLLSPNCADAFSPKTVQATMGALARVRPHCVSLTELLEKIGKDTTIYGTFLDDSANLYRTPLKQSGIIVMGSEGNGISPEIERLITQRIHIPNYPVGAPTSESLNVAIATAITVSEFRRNHLEQDL